MDSRFMRGLIVGGMVGAALSMMTNAPTRSRRRAYRTGRRIAGRAMDMAKDIGHIMK
jgi:gas vesicle protein